ncbi:MAG: T9SS type A sorting domain-containing protein [Bacteroidota bacterium]
MKKTILIAILFISVAQARGQGYHKLLETEKYWDIAYTSGGTVCNIDNGMAYRYFISGDTLISGKSYSLFSRYHMSSVSVNPYCPPFIVDTISQFYTLFLKEDTITKQVFVYANSQDNLIYDFSLDSGDTLQSSYAGGDSILTIDSVITSLFPDGSNRKTFYLNSGHFYIEGIGAANGLGVPFTPFFESSFWLMCVKQNGISLYGEEPYCDSYFIGISEHDFDSFAIKPNPATSSITLQMPQLEGDAEVCVFKSLGEQVLKTKLHKAKSEVRIDVAKLPAGLYFVKMNNYSGKFVKQ